MCLTENYWDFIYIKKYVGYVVFNKKSTWNFLEEDKCASHLNLIRWLTGWLMKTMKFVLINTENV